MSCAVCRNGPVDLHTCRLKAEVQQRTGGLMARLVGLATFSAALRDRAGTIWFCAHNHRSAAELSATVEIWTPCDGAVSTYGCSTSSIIEVVLSSTRRVKKGPGRRPQSAKRQRFMQFRERGWSIAAAAREVGVSRSAANNWARGYKVYRKGRVVGFVSPLDRLAAREQSALPVAG